MLKMHQIREIFDLSDSGFNQSEISRILEIDRKTVGTYLSLTDFNDKILEEAALHKPRVSKLDPYKQIIIDKIEELERLKKSHKMRWTATRMHSYLVEEMGFEELRTSYLLIQRFMKELRETKKKSYRDKGTMPLKWYPGEAQCDFGEADFLEEGNEEAVTYKFLVLSFPHSNKMFSLVAPGENCQCVCQCLKDIFEYMGRVPKRIVFDNATGIGHRIQKILEEHEEFTRFRLHYGFEATFANPYSGNEKGSVENAVGTFRRNRFVPLKTIKVNLEYFNKNVVLPMADEFRADEEHYKKGETVDELFRQDMSLMRPLPETDFRVCKIVSYMAHDGKVLVDGKYEYHLDPQVNGSIFVEKTMYSISFFNMQGKLLETCDRIYNSDEVYYNLPSILNGLIRKTNAWRNSVVRYNMEDGPLKDLIDGMDDSRARSNLFYCLYNNTFAFGYGETIHAANILAGTKGKVEKDDLRALCGRFAAIDFNEISNPTGVSLDKYDTLLHPTKEVI